ncbi:hypothetical protein [Photobacterium halotolerans]|nr:hypothetical protein [Photobacterium halotolerans]
MERFVYILLMVFSIDAISEVDTNSFEYKLFCKDLEQGIMIEDSDIGVYPEYEMDDGYSGEIEFNLLDGKITIIHQGLFIASKSLTSNAVKIDGEQITVTISPYSYYNFLFVTKLSSIQYVNIENEGNEEEMFTCNNPNSSEKTKEMMRYVKEIKSKI